MHTDSPSGRAGAGGGGATKFYFLSWAVVAGVPALTFHEGPCFLYVLFRASSMLCTAASSAVQSYTKYGVV